MSKVWLIEHEHFGFIGTSTNLPSENAGRVRQLGFDPIEGLSFMAHIKNFRDAVETHFARGNDRASPDDIRQIMVERGHGYAAKPRPADGPG